MPFRYADARPELRAEILDRVSCGERLTAVCAGDGMPCVESVRNWGKWDAGFGLALAQAQRASRLRRKVAREIFDPWKAAQILERLRGGEKIEDMVREPGMPTLVVYRLWRRADAGFGAAVAAWIASREPARLRAVRAARYRDFDRKLAERIYVRCYHGAKLRDVLRADPELPCEAVVARWRREDADFAMQMRVAFRRNGFQRGRARHGCTEALMYEVAARIAVGHSLRSLSRMPDMPCLTSLYAWVRTRPDFAELVAMACKDRADWYFQRMDEIAAAAVAGTVAEAKRQIGRLASQEARLRRRPGWKRRKAAGAG